jgi:hypothetical protein
LGIGFDGQRREQSLRDLLEPTTSHVG